MGNYRMKGARPHVYPVDPSPEPSPMRSFDDNSGGHWQAALMEASFGNTLLVLSRICGDGVLVKPLQTANSSEAERWLADARDVDLRQCLDEGKPFP